MATRKVTKGEAWRPDSADDHNIKARTADAYRRGNPFTPDREHPIDPCRIWVRNTSGGDRRQFECLELSETIVLNKIQAHQLFIDGIEPTGEDIPFAVLLEPEPDGSGFRRGQVAGICPALVDVVSTDHVRAYLPSGQYVLKSGDEGPVAIVQKPAATGEQLCVVLFQAESDFTLYEFCLAENHPGRGVVFEVYLGTWDPDEHDYCFGGDPVKAIDWRYEVPYPDAGARGQGYFKTSTAHGRILIPIDMDCESPGACPDCGEES